MTKKNKVIILVFLLILASAAAIYAFDLMPFIKKGTAKLTNNNLVNQVSDEDRTIAIPSQINNSNDCVVLDKTNCSLGKPIYENNQLVAVGFNLPLSSVVYAPFKAKYEKNAQTSLVINGVGYSSIELMDISKNDWGTSDTRSYFSVTAYSQTPINTENLEKKQPITVFLSKTDKAQGDYNLILTFKEYNLKTNEWKTNIDLLKQYFPNLEK